jgi:hypothetical protein
MPDGSEGACGAHYGKIGSLTDVPHGQPQPAMLSTAGAKQAQTQDDAVLSAITNVESAGIGARVLRVDQDDNWLTASEIAERTGRTRQSIGLLIRATVAQGAFRSPRHGRARTIRCGAGPRSPRGSNATSRARSANTGLDCRPTSWPSSTIASIYVSVNDTRTDRRGESGWPRRSRSAPDFRGPQRPRAQQTLGPRQSSGRTTRVAAEAYHCC